MATKKRLEQLENLLDWEREGNRLPETTELFNRRIGETLGLNEVTPRMWIISTTEVDDGHIKRNEMLVKNETLIQLALTILDAQKVVSDRFAKGEG